MKNFFNKEEKKEIIVGFISFTICGSILLGYCGLMKKQYDEFSITSVSYINNVVIAIKSGAYKKASNKEMINMVDKIKGEREDPQICFDAYRELEKKYSVEEIKEFASSSIKNNREDYSKYLIHKTEELGILNIGTAFYVNPLEKYNDIKYDYLGNLMLPINFAFVYMMMVISIIYLIYNLIRNKEIDWIVAFLCTLILANLFTLIVGAPFESQRLFFASISVILLMIAKFMDSFNKKNKMLEG